MTYKLCLESQVEWDSGGDNSKRQLTSLVQKTRCGHGAAAGHIDTKEYNEARESVIAIQYHDANRIFRDS